MNARPSAAPVLAALAAAVCLAPAAAAAAPKPDLLIELRSHGGEIWSAAFHPNGSRLCTGAADGQLIAWNFAAIRKEAPRLVRKGKLDAIPSATWELDRRRIGDKVGAVAFDRTGGTLAACGNTRWGNGYGASTHLYVNGRKDPFKIGASPAAWSPTSAAFNRTGRFLALGSRNDELKVVRLDPQPGGKLKRDPRTAPGVPGEVWDVAFHPTEAVVAACGGTGGGRSWKGWVRLYAVNLDGLRPLVTGQPIEHAGGGTEGLAFTPDGDRLVTVAADGELRVTRIPSGEPAAVWKAAGFDARGLALHPAEPWALVGGTDGTARLIDYDTGAVLAELEGHDGHVRGLAFTADGVHAATGGAGHLLRLWDLNVPPVRGRR